MNTSKSGSPPKRAKKRSPTTVSTKQYNALLQSAQALHAKVQQLEQEKWASNILFAGALAKLGGSISIERDTLTALVRPWEIRHDHDHENHIYHVRLLQAADLEAEKEAASAAALAAVEQMESSS